MRPDPVMAEGDSEARHVGLDRVPCSLGRCVAPDLVHQGLCRDQLVRSDQQVGEKRPLLRSTEGNRTTPPVDLEGAEDTEVHLASEHPLTAPGWYERLHLLRDVEFLGNQLEDVDGIGESLQMQFPVIEVPDAIDRAGEMNQVLTGEDLAG